MPNAGFTPVFPRSLGPGENLGYRSTLVLEEEDPPCKVLLFVLSMSLDCAALDSYIPSSHGHYPSILYHAITYLFFFFFFFIFPYFHLPLPFPNTTAEFRASVEILDALYDLYYALDGSDASWCCRPFKGMTLGFVKPIIYLL